MKKLLLVIAVSALFMNVQAQRTVDMETSIVAPSAGSTIFAMAPFNIIFRLQNNGPDQILPGDSITSFLVLGNQIQLSTAETQVVQQALADGATRDITREFTVQGGQSGQFDICILAV